MMKTFIPLLLCLYLPITYAQDFNLFDPERGRPPPAPPKSQTPPSNPFAPKIPPKPVTPPPPPQKQLQPQKDFVLRGTSIIGEKRIAILQAPDGKQIIQYFEGNKKTPIVDHTNYFLIGLEAREVVIEYPEDAPCRQSRAEQLQCSPDQKSAVLKLVALDAIAPPTPPIAPIPAPIPPPQVGNPPDGQPVTLSPFGQPRELTPEEQQKREEERQKRAELYKNFQKRVINPEDVPPGMRLVRTPFGDRLVPEK